MQKWQFCWRRALLRSWIAAVLLTGCRTVDPSAADTESLKKLALADLMDIEVTSVSRTSTPLSATPASVEVITGDDLRRSGATTLAEALRLAPNLQVAQVNAHDWGITARGFNGVSVNTGSLADKLLVMIDGRSIYTPLFGGVFWDAQHVFLEDVERIEVVSGPGGTLWGANAINGVINVITKSAAQTKGGTLSLGAGANTGKSGAVRYGGAAGDDFSYRAYAQRIDGDSTRRADADAGDEWQFEQGGFRTDYRRSDTDSLTVQGDFYEGEEGDPHTTFINGQNVLARWTHTTSPQSEWVAQAYVDRTVRTFPRVNFRDELLTTDVDLQHRYNAAQRHTIVWGAGYRHMRDDVRNAPSITFLPAQKTMQLASAFAQDEIAAAKHMKVTIGAKLEHNGFSGLEAQPSVRVAWTPPGKQMAWTAISRAVRAPSRFDADLGSIGNPDFMAETVIAYELGYRVRPYDALSLSFAAFHHRYDDIRSINQNPTRLEFDNDQRARSSGIEFSGLLVATDWWRLRGGYTHLQKSFASKNARVLPISAPFEAQDPRNQALVQSIMDLPRGLQLDVVARFIGEIPATALGPRIPSYTTADVRIARRFSRWELAAIGRNLGGSHPEFLSPALPYEIPRSVQGRLTFTW